MILGLPMPESILECLPYGGACLIDNITMRCETSEAKASSSKILTMVR